MKAYDSYRLHKELKDAGLPIVGCSSTGRIDWDGEPTAKQEADAAAILAAHDPTPPVVIQPVDPKIALGDEAEAAKDFAELKAAIVAYARAV